MMKAAHSFAGDSCKQVVPLPENFESHARLRTDLRSGCYSQGHAAHNEMYHHPIVFADVCFIDVARWLGCKVPYTRSGPFKAYTHGNDMLRDFGKRLRRVTGKELSAEGKYVYLISHS